MQTRDIPFGEYTTHAQITGVLPADGGTRRPLVVLHGGPGCTLDYVLSIADLADRGEASVPVVHYDQLGNGRSTHLPEKGADFWTVQLFLDELDNLLKTLGIADDYDLLGQSWGGMLGAEHAVRRPTGLKHLVIADSPASMDLWMEAAAGLRAELPPEVERALSENEAAGTTTSPEYLHAMDVFYGRHVCRLDPQPAEVVKTFEYLAQDPTVYNLMNGPSEFHVIGTLRSWSIVDRVGQIEVPTLVINGRYDEATDATVAPFVEGIPNATWHRFEESSHMPHVEEREAYMDVVHGFLSDGAP